jgi:TonB family protein
MARHSNIFLIALACSLCLHLLSLSAYVEYSRWHMPVATIAKPRHPQTRPATSAAEELIVVYPDMGDATGTGIGSNSSPGDQALQAMQAKEDQALLSRNPTGSGRIGAVPSKWIGPTGDGNGGTPAIAVLEPPSPAVTPPQAAAVTPTPATPPAPPVQVAASVPLPRVEVAPIASDPEPKVVAIPTPAVNPVPPAPKVVVTPERKQEVPPEHQQVAVAKPQAATGDGRTPGMPQASGDPLPQSESDSDPFSRISGTIVFRPGKLDVRLGRKVKTTRPRIQIAGQIDFIQFNNPTVVLEVHISATGKVTDVKVAHSSGSNQIDEPTRLAVYDWWFEPLKDKNGKAISDVYFFSIEFVG